MELKIRVRILCGVQYISYICGMKLKNKTNKSLVRELKKLITATEEAIKDIDKKEGYSDEEAQEVLAPTWSTRAPTWSTSGTVVWTSTSGTIILDGSSFTYTYSVDPVTTTGTGFISTSGP
jgi:hypothetical protein